MLKFRFRKKELRRRSNSCPNLDTCAATFDSGIRNERGTTVIDKHTSCYLEGRKSDNESENEALSPTRKERQHAQKSIRKVKKKEKEQQENVEKNLLSVDDFWRKLDSLKEWLNDEQGGREVEDMQSPKLRSHFKKFIKLWNKRKLPLKYYKYKNCCVDGEAESSSAELPHAHQTDQSPTNRLHGQNNAFTFDFLSQTKLKNMPSYHHFPFVDESSDQDMLSESPALSSSLFSSQSMSFKDKDKDSTMRTDEDSNVGSPFSTFGKSMNDPHTSTSLLAQQIDVRASQRKDSKSKNKSGPISPCSTTSPKKFATISRSTPASSVFHFKSSSPQIHAVGSPTCPHRPALSLPISSTQQQGPDTDRSTKNPSPAYMSVQDAIPFDTNSSPSPKYWQVGFDDVFEEPPESHYCSLSPFLAGKKSSTQNNNAMDFSSNLSRNPSNLSRRRSKSLEDIYAVPSRLLTYDVRKKINSPFLEDGKSMLPPVPVKKFTPTSSLVSLAGRLISPSNLTSAECTDTLVSSSQTINAFSSVISSSSTDVGYQSGKLEDSSDSHRYGSSTTFLSSFKSQQSFAGAKRRSQEHETNVDEIDYSPKKSKPTTSHENTNSVDETGSAVFDERKENTLVDDDDGSVDMSIAGFLKDSQKSKMDTSSPSKTIPKKSILTGSLYPTTRTPKTDLSRSGSKKDKDRLSILQIKVLDKSPTFPRRRVKRRSSSLAVTPGKGLTFGNKNNGRMAVSSPRRVSFAKNVKSCNDEKTTPSRMKPSSSSSMSVSASKVKNDISRQSHDKAEFESFWAHYEKKCHKPNSPVKEGGNSNSSKPWSPSKWLSPSKETTSSQSKETTFSPSKESTFSPSKETTFSPSKETTFSPSKETTFFRENSQSSIDPKAGEGKSSFIKSLSPKKLFTSLQKNSSSSSLLPNPDSNAPASGSSSSLSHHGEMLCIKEPGKTTVNSKPKSILKIGTTAFSPVTTTNSTNAVGSQSSISPHKQEQTFPPRRPNHLFTTTHGYNRPFEFNADACRSPPRLGVASLKATRFAATQNISSLPRSKQQLLFEAKSSQSVTALAAEPNSHLNSLAGAANAKSLDESPKQIDDHYHHVPPTNILMHGGHNNDNELIGQQNYTMSQGHQHGFDGVSNNDTSHELPHRSLSCPKGEANEMNDRIYDNALSSLGQQLASWSHEHRDDYNYNLPVEMMTSPISNCSFSKSAEKENSWSDNKINHISQTPTQTKIQNESEGFDAHYHQSPRVEEMQNMFIINPNIDDVDCCDKETNEFSNSTQHGGSGMLSGETLDCDSHTGSQSQSVTSEGGDKQLSQNVLERIKSFRASPKVEDNDGWITERRRSKGSKSKSFRNSPNQSLVQSPLRLQERVGAKPTTATTTTQGKGDGVLGMDITTTELLDNTPMSISGNSQEDVFSGRLLHQHDTGVGRDLYLDKSNENSHKSENETESISVSVLDRVQPNVAIGDDDMTVCVDVDKGYETESRSSYNYNDKKVKCLGRRGGDYEDESVSSVTSSDSGNCLKYDAVSSTLPCPIYDVPKPGFHAVTFTPTNLIPCPESPLAKPVHNNSMSSSDATSSTDTSECRVNSSMEYKQSCSIDNDNFSQQKDIPSNNIPVSTPHCPSTQPSLTLTSNETRAENKENARIPVKPTKPKPLVRPKPKPSPKPGGSTITTTMHRAPATSSLSPKVKIATCSSQPTVKRRSSVAKRESISFRKAHRPSISSSFKSNHDCHGNNQITRPVVRKQSSVVKRETSLRGKPLNNSPTANTTHTQSRVTPHKHDTKRESSIITASGRRKRTSLEKTGRRSSTGVPSGPEQSSFAQRRKFFQQLQTSTNVSSSTSTLSSAAAPKRQPSSVKVSNSFLVKSRPKPAPKPIAGEGSEGT